MVAIVQQSAGLIQGSLVGHARVAVLGIRPVVGCHFLILPEQYRNDMERQNVLAVSGMMQAHQN